MRIQVYTNTYTHKHTHTHTHTHTLIHTHRLSGKLSVSASPALCVSHMRRDRENAREGQTHTEDFIGFARNDGCVCAIRCHDDEESLKSGREREGKDVGHTRTSLHRNPNTHTLITRTHSRPCTHKRTDQVMWCVYPRRMRAPLPIRAQCVYDSQHRTVCVCSLDGYVECICTCVCKR